MTHLCLTILRKSSHYFILKNPHESYDASFDHMTSRLNPEANALFDEDQLVDGLNAIAWTSEESQYLESSILNGPIATICFSATPDVSCLPKRWQCKFHKLTPILKLFCPG